MNTDSRHTAMCCDLIVVNNSAYEALCNEHGVSRAIDIDPEEVLKVWKQHCELTHIRASHILSLISRHNFNNPSKQIQGKYSVYGNVIKLTINGTDYDREDYVNAIVALRNKGIRVPYI